MILTTFSLLSCVSSKIVEIPKVNPIIPEVTVGFNEFGWDKSYDINIRLKTTETMLSVPNSRMKDFCPKWDSMVKEERATFWSDLLYSISSPESSHYNSSLYYEDTQGADEVTGLSTKTSEGLLQLSYSDVLSYKCDFDYSLDKQDHLDDIARKPAGKHSWRSTHWRTKSILNPYRNLGCGILIIDKLLRSDKRNSDNLSTLLGRYWITMRPSNQGYSEIVALMKNRKSKCF